jgi:hypothetical protein
MKELLKRTMVVRAVLVVIALLILSVGVYFFLQYQRTQQLLKNPNLAAQAEAQSLVTKVGRLMDLPKGEQPTIATVSDVTKLQGQSFFKNAKNGFKVLIFTKAKKAILYDPKGDKIVEVTVLALEQPAASASAEAKPVTVVLYNGTTTSGLATTVEKQIKDKGIKVTVALKANASKQDYTKTIVVDLTGKNASIAKDLATFLGGEVGSLPAGETKPTGAEILIILGK